MRELTPLHLRLLIGVGVKSLGYLIVAAGIFLSLKDKALALKVVYIGVSFVIFGWFLVFRALRLAKAVRLKKHPKFFERRFKISAHVSSGFLGVKEGDSVEISGCVMGKFDKSWKYVDGNVLIVLDGIPIGKVRLNDGKFSFVIPNLRRGTYDVHVRFVEGCEEKRLRIKVLSRREWKRNILTFVLAVLILILISFAVVIPIFMS